MFTGLESPVHILMLLVLGLVLFGAKRLPEIGRSLGSGMREFKQSITGEQVHAETVSAAAALPCGVRKLDPRGQSEP